MAFQEERKFFFVSQAYPEDTFAVVRFKGTEGISRLYEFEILLVAEDPDIDIKKVLNNPARFTIARDDKEVIFNGILAYFDQLHEVDEYVFYRTLLVPRLWVSTIHHENELFLDQSVPEIIEEILKQAGLTSRDYEFKLTGNYPKWEYICQYRETDYNFISRWMEREGIYFFFDQTDEGEKLIITDTSSAHQDLPEDSTIYYSPPSALVPTEEEVIKAFVCRQRRLPKKVILKDYNYRKPSLEIKGEATVDPEGKGEVYLYGEHFKTPEEGNHLAKIRAEEMLCREKIFYGESTAPHLRPGYYFQLEDHYRDSFNQKYLVVEIEHEGSQAGLLLAGLSEELTEEEQDLIYHNRFVAISADVQFRPERKTPKPRFYGTMNAKIDASGDGKYAEIDEWGRYKVILPFDMKNKGGGKASRWIRMAQPYAGAGFGMHFPLHKGTEVILTFIDGDPDRPIIAGAVPNPETMSPVTSENQTQCIIRSGGGNQIHMEDQDGKQLVKLYSPTANSSIRIGAPNPSGEIGIYQETKENMQTIIGGWETRVVGTQMSLNPTAKQTIYIEGDREVTVTGNENITVDKNRKLHIKGNQEVTIDGKSKVDWKSDLLNIAAGYTNEIFLGEKASAFYGLAIEHTYSAKISRGKTLELKDIPKFLKSFKSKYEKGDSFIQTIKNVKKTIKEAVIETTKLEELGKEKKVKYDEILIESSEDIHIKRGKKQIRMKKGSPLLIKNRNSKIQVTGGSIDVKTRNVNIKGKINLG